MSKAAMQAELEDWLEQWAREQASEGKPPFDGDWGYHTDFEKHAELWARAVVLTIEASRLGQDAYEENAQSAKQEKAPPK